jgi:Bacterial protein of unknown function (DUF839)
MGINCWEFLLLMEEKASAFALDSFKGRHQEVAVKLQSTTSKVDYSHFCCSNDHLSFAPPAENVLYLSGNFECISAILWVQAYKQAIAKSLLFFAVKAAPKKNLSGKNQISAFALPGRDPIRSKNREICPKGAYEIVRRFISSEKDKVSASTKGKDKATLAKLPDHFSGSNLECTQNDQVSRCKQPPKKLDELYFGSAEDKQGDTASIGTTFRNCPESTETVLYSDLHFTLDSEFSRVRSIDFANPDNLLIDGNANVWIVTDISPGKPNNAVKSRTNNNGESTYCGVIRNNAVKYIVTDSKETEALLVSAVTMKCATTYHCLTPEERTQFLLTQQRGKAKDICQKQVTEVREFLLYYSLR